MNKSIMSMVVSDALWAGTERSLYAHIDLLVRQAARDASVAQSAAVFGNTQKEAVLPYLLEVNKGVGIISIKGPMTNNTSYWDEMGKAATYPAIRDALVNAANNPDVKQILLDVDSGGGAVSGLADVATLVRAINNGVKTVTAFTDGNMMSAAYWVGSAASKVYASKAAGVGSIGVIATHMEQSKMMAEMGVNVTVMRSGKFKALANRYEPLTDAAKEQIQASLDASYGVFVQHVADMRDVSYNTADSTMANGKEFFGEQAKSAGLVDEILTFDEVFAKIQTSIDNQQSLQHNPTNIITKGKSSMKLALTEQQIAAMASGVQVAASSTEAVVVIEPVVEKPAEAQAAAVEVAAVTTPAVVESAALVPYLQAQVAERDVTLLALSVKHAGLEATVADMSASASGLLAIASASVNNMRIAMGGSAMDMSAMTAVSVLAEHSAISKQFSEKFKVGGVAAVDAAQTEKPMAEVSDAFQAAQMRAVRGSKTTKSK